MGSIPARIIPGLAMLASESLIRWAKKRVSAHVRLVAGMAAGATYGFRWAHCCTMQKISTD